MARTELATRPLGPDDAAAGFALSTEAGWNQTVADWQFMLAAGDARGQVTPTGDLVASALVLPFADRIGWIGMVLTTASHQRRGLATENLRWAIAHCEAGGLIAGLDATPAGRLVYAPLGFADGFGLQRLTAEEPTLAVPDAPGIRPMEAGDMPAVTALDGTAFGAERAALLRYLQGNRTSCAWVAEEDGAVSGFLLARSGRITLHLGPLIAPSSDTALAIVSTALAAAKPTGPVSIDVPDAQGRFCGRLGEAGFAPVRPFTRMLRDQRTILGSPETIFAIAGPELG